MAPHPPRSHRSTLRRTHYRCQSAAQWTTRLRYRLARSIFMTPRRCRHPGHRCGARPNPVSLRSQSSRCSSSISRSAHRSGNRMRAGTYHQVGERSHRHRGDTRHDRNLAKATSHGWGMPCGGRGIRFAYRREPIVDGIDVLQASMESTILRVSSASAKSSTKAPRALLRAIPVTLTWVLSSSAPVLPTR